MKERNFTGHMKCNHCTHSDLTMEIVSVCKIEHPHNSSYYDDGRYSSSYTIFELVKCPACFRHSLRRHYWNDDIDPSNVTFEILWPTSAETEQNAEGLPTLVAQAYKAAQDVRDIDTNAYGVLIGRLLEAICVDLKAEGSSVREKFDYLGKKGIVSKSALHLLRDFRDIGAHFELGELSRAELPILDSLVQAILTSTYGVSYHIEQAKTRLKQLKNTSSEDGSDSKAPEAS